jgi:hypothetical protein
MAQEKKEFQIFMAKGKKPNLMNEHDLPARDFLHPLKYSKNIKKKPAVYLIPMNYKFQRKFYEHYLDLKKI